jgi:hypothetical protein
MGVSTKGEPIAPRADLLAKFYSLPPVDAGGSAALGRWGHANVTAVDVAAIVSTAVAAEITIIFGFFVVIIVIVILQRSAKEEASCYRVLLGL